MTLKHSFPIAIAVGLGLSAFALRPACPVSAATSTPPAKTTFAEHPLDDPPALANAALPAACPVSGVRNLFAFVDPPARAVVSKPAPVVSKVVVAEPTPVVEQKIAPPAEPEFPFQYIGNFGPRADPIAVFVADHDVVNARRGDAIGSFRLSRIGVESVEVASASGAVRRVALRP